MSVNSSAGLVLASGAVAVGLALAVSWRPLAGPGPAADLLAIGGLDQTGTVGSELSAPITVRLVDARGRGIAGSPITFATASGGGEVLVSVTTTDDEGRAVNRWTLGRFAHEPQVLEARSVVPGTGATLVTSFRATSRPDQPASLVKEPTIESVVGSWASGERALAVRVIDRYGNPVPGTRVTWEVEAGGGAVFPRVTVTDDAGVTRTVWALGETGGSQSARATAGAAVVAFTASVPSPDRMVFFDDFESGLSKWTDGPHRAHSARLVADPVRRNNLALHFTQLGAGADLLSVPIQTAPGEFYRLQFDYLGVPAAPGVDDLGGYIGVTDGLRGRQVWLAGTNVRNAAMDVEDDGRWHTYSVTFSSDEFHPAPMRIMLEDFDQPGGVAGDAYFDNVSIRVEARRPPYDR